MRLTHIKLAGFKSFVDPTTITIPGQLVSIVGPNGCGKSNVVDAIRWVMGESSAKHLRGESMSDVIFNGSSSRKPVGQASVELVFDNSDGSIGGEYAQYSTIAVKRQVNRDGQSNYYLNGSRCRRKDIADVFLGTGLGSRSYSIIEQGMISRFIEAKPDDLRVYIEEAAGISKYKERRRETENRIRHTRENLERVEDVREEVAKQLEHLQRQAKAAERYKVLKSEERVIKAQLLALQWQELDTQSHEVKQNLQQQTIAIESKQAEQQRLVKTIEEQRQNQVAANEQFNAVQGQYYALNADITRLEQSITHHRERLGQLQTEQQQIERHWQEVTQHIEQDETRITELQAQIVQQTPELESGRQTVEQMRSELNEAEQSLRDWQHTWDEFNQQASETIQKARIEQTTMQHLEQQIKDANKRLQTLQQEQQQFDNSAIEAQISALQSQLQSLTDELKQQQTMDETIHTDLARKTNEYEAHKQSLDELNEQVQIARGRRTALQALQQAEQGEGEGSVNQWLDEKQLAERERLAQQLTVTQGWETAIEIVMGTSLEAVCVDNITAFANDIQSVKQGKLVLFEMQQASTSDISSQPRLIDQIQSSYPLDSFLSGIYCTDNLSTAMKFREKLKVGESIITRDGIWLGKDWLQVKKTNNENNSILQREQELKQIKQQLSQMEVQQTTLQKQIEQEKQAITQAETQRESARQQLETLRQQQHKLETQLQVKCDQIKRNQQQAEKIVRDIQALQQIISNSEQQLKHARDVWQNALNITEQHTGEKQSLQQQRESLQATLSQQRQQLQQLQQQSNQQQIQHNTAQTQLHSLQENQQRMQTQFQQLQQRRVQLQQILATTDNPVEELQQELSQTLEKQVSEEAHLTQAKQRVSEVNYRLQDLEKQMDTVVKSLDDLRSEAEQYRLNMQTVSVRQTTLEEQIAALNTNLEAIIQDLPEQANVVDWQQEAEKVALRIQRLGAINLAAIDESKAQAERKQYLDDQYEDLTSALTILENAIGKIDQETKIRFQQTFDNIDQGFQQLFPRVFGGGSARLQLTDDDLLSTGITVIAQPPGKRNTSIHLLSGGEKALTAVALVFAIFRLNPAPFCLLDEVDAPLDDANVGRYCDLVRDMSKEVQFIFITHNKIAMEMAEQLMGVTMQEPGVSRIVSVDVDQAAELAAA